VEELRELVEQLEQGDPEDDLIDESPQKRRKKKPGRIGKLPSHIAREIHRHVLFWIARAEGFLAQCGDGLFAFFRFVS
jgi:hypothetical protein